ncbi:hypothetical protein L2E82_03650 [Cichorium intybus]|uniref:Uncharacterized protein n=1 Tax=Cichorium intybus TaxID=13427 RepID=A0ACB9H5B5_CICIN|nr:hypothetical protein L2E82_03650 [Cichorium intybus]
MLGVAGNSVAAKAKNSDPCVKQSLPFIFFGIQRSRQRRDIFPPNVSPVKRPSPLKPLPSPLKRWTNKCPFLLHSSVYAGINHTSGDFSAPEVLTPATLVPSATAGRLHSPETVTTTLQCLMLVESG